MPPRKKKVVTKRPAPVEEEVYEEEVVEAKPKSIADDFNSVSGLSSTIEKLGLPTALLVVFSYFAWTGVIQPVVTTVQTAIADVAETNKELQKTQEENNKSNDERVKLISTMFEQNHLLLEQILEKVSRENGNARSE